MRAPYQHRVPRQAPAVASRRRAAAALLLAALPLWHAACRNESDTPALPATGPLRGAPIDSAPSPARAAADRAEGRPSHASAQAPIQDQVSTPAGATPAPSASAAGAAPDAAAQNATPSTPPAAASRGPIAPPADANPPPASLPRDAESRLTFDQLRDFTYEPPTPEQLAAAGDSPDALRQIPPAVSALSGRRVTIEGFMAPLRIEDGRVTAFMLCYNRMFCCFGLMPAMNEWVYVEMGAGRSTEYFNDVVVGVQGVLSVGERVQDGMVMSLYRLTAERVTFQSGM